MLAAIATSFVSLANEIAAERGAKITITEDVAEAVRDCDVLFTDVWVSVGEPAEAWGERIKLLTQYQINAQTRALTGNTIKAVMVATLGS